MYWHLQAEWAYEYYGLEENLVNPIREFWNEGPSGIMDRIKNKASEYFQFDRTRVTVWGPGELQVSFQLIEMLK